MADVKTSSGGWIKAVFGTFAGLLSGGVMMYVSPLVDRVIKPGKPVANFAVEANGLEVIVQNRSTVGDGWCDFGDGSPLEVVTAPTQSIKHVYPKPGTYSVKLSVHNFLGDDNDRTVSVDVKPSAPPAIVSLQAIPVCNQSIAPATYRFVTKTSNADTCIWDFGDDRPWEISADVAAEQDRVVTFQKPGTYTVQLAVLNGKQSDRKTIQIPVMACPSGGLMGVLTVVDSGTKVERKTELTSIPINRGEKDQALERTIEANRGYLLKEAKIAGKLPTGLKDITVTIAKDQKTAVIRGTVLAATAPKSSDSSGNMAPLPLNIVQEKATPSRRPTQTTVSLKPGANPVAMALSPKDWTGVQREARLEIRDGERVILPAGPLPKNTPLNWNGKQYSVTATPVGDQIRVDVVEGR